MASPIIPPKVDEISKQLKEVTTIVAHEDFVKQKSEQVLKKEIPWEGYHKANLILERELQLIKQFDKKPIEAKIDVIFKELDVYAELFLELLIKINKEDTLQYLLVLIDQILTAKPELSQKIIELFLGLSSKKPSFPYEPFLRILGRSNLDWLTNSKASTILATLMSSPAAKDIPEEHVTFLCQWLRTQLASTEERDICNAVSALQKFLKKDQFRLGFSFPEKDGLFLLGALLRTSKNSQILYQTINCIWLLTYSSQVAAQINDTKIITSLVEILRQSPKEKVIRMTLATLRNLIDISKNNEQMIDADLMKPLQSLSERNWGDEDIIEDLTVIKESLQKNLVVLSSFDIYRKEVMSGKLEWSPVHKSERFWRENAALFEEEKFKVLLALKEILSTSNDPVSLSVACFDVGEFGRHHPRGRIIAQNLNLKIPILKLMEDGHPEVRKQALLAIQKLMVHNWEYLIH